MPVTTVKSTAKSATKSAKSSFPSKSPQPLNPCTPLKPILQLKIVIVKGSYWDSPEGREKIKKQIAETERIMGIEIETGEWETIDDPSLKKVDDGNWDGKNNYSKEQVDAMNRLGDPDAPAMLYTDEAEDSVAIAVSHAWEGEEDGLQREGAIMGKDSEDKTLAHELGHLLSGEAGNNTHSNDKDNLMWPTTDGGDEWTDPWKASSEKSPYMN